MSIPDEQIKFGTEIKIQSGHVAELISVKVSDLDELVIYKIWKNKNKKNLGTSPYTYISHQYCGGSVYNKNMNKYNLLYCLSCSLRIQLPLYIKTFKDLLNYFKDYQEEEQINQNRFKLMDL